MQQELQCLEHGIDHRSGQLTLRGITKRGQRWIWKQWGKKADGSWQAWWGYTQWSLLDFLLQHPVAVSTQAQMAWSFLQITPRITPVDKSACTSSLCQRTTVYFYQIFRLLKICFTVSCLGLFRWSSRINAYVNKYKGDWKLFSGTVACYLYFVVVSKDFSKFLNYQKWGKAQN